MNNKKDKSFRKKAIGASLLLVIVAAVTLEATTLLQNYYSHRVLKHEASLRAASELESAQNEIMVVINQTEAALRNSLWIAQWCLETQDSLSRVPQRIVTDNPVVAGSTIALRPGFWMEHPLYAPYCARVPETGSTQMLSLATEDYDYPSKEWFVMPFELGTGYWSEPYFDEGGGNILMTTYSLPVRDAGGDIAAVLTADISLDWLGDVIGDLKGYPNAFSMIVSRTGRIMACPVQELVMKKTVDQFAAETRDSSSLNAVNRNLLAGETGGEVATYKGEKHLVFYAPVERTGWSLSIALPEKEVYKGVNQVGIIVSLLQLLGLSSMNRRNGCRASSASVTTYRWR
jgi:sigma-B regulation protein RsbU (phosphoserine phosphatase)